MSPYPGLMLCTEYQQRFPGKPYLRLLVITSLVRLEAGLKDSGSTSAILFWGRGRMAWLLPYSHFQHRVVCRTWLRMPRALLFSQRSGMSRVTSGRCMF